MLLCKHISQSLLERRKWNVFPQRWWVYGPQGSYCIYQHWSQERWHSLCIPKHPDSSSGFISKTCKPRVRTRGSASTQALVKSLLAQIEFINPWYTVKNKSQSLSQCCGPFSCVIWKVSSLYHAIVQLHLNMLQNQLNYSLTSVLKIRQQFWRWYLFSVLPSLLPPHQKPFILLCPQAY